jgi:hypothetical protein
MVWLTIAPAWRIKWVSIGSSALACKITCAFAAGFSPWLAMGEFAQENKLKPGAQRQFRKNIE